jgi:hypothetical protein
MMFEVDPYIGTSCLRGEPSIKWNAHPQGRWAPWRPIRQGIHIMEWPPSGSLVITLIDYDVYKLRVYNPRPCPTLLPITQPLFPFSSVPVFLLLVNFCQI